MSRTRPVDVGRFALGLTAVARPDAVLALGSSPARTGVLRGVVRVLGARYLVQSGTGLVGARRWLPAVDALVDLTHAGSMVLAARIWPQHRRLALLSAGTATAFATLDAGEHVR